MSPAVQTFPRAFYPLGESSGQLHLVPSFAVRHKSSHRPRGLPSTFPDVPPQLWINTTPSLSLVIPRSHCSSCYVAIPTPVAGQLPAFLRPDHDISSLGRTLPTIPSSRGFLPPGFLSTPLARIFIWTHYFGSIPLPSWSSEFPSWIGALSRALPLFLRFRMTSSPYGHPYCRWESLATSTSLPPFPFCQIIPPPIFLSAHFRIVYIACCSTPNKKREEASLPPSSVQGRVPSVFVVVFQSPLVLLSFPSLLQFLLVVLSPQSSARVFPDRPSVSPSSPELSLRPQTPTRLPDLQATFPSCLPGFPGLPSLR